MRSKQATTRGQRFNLTQVKAMMVEERKKQRAKTKASLFMSKTRGIYAGQQNRAMECQISMDYSLEQLREKVAKALPQCCPYCPKKMTIKNLAVDHKLPIARGGNFSIMNIVVCHNFCNWRKGLMTDHEFKEFSGYVNSTFPPEVVADIWRRLTTGGRWSR